MRCASCLRSLCTLTVAGGGRQAHPQVDQRGARNARNSSTELYKPPAPKVVAPSSGEAALNAHVLGLCKGLGTPTLSEEWGMPGIVESMCDRSVAGGIASRVRSGKFRHLQVKQVWIQGLVRCCTATCSRVPRLLSSADAMTHPGREATLRTHTHLSRVGALARPRLSSSGTRGVVCTSVCGKAMHVQSVPSADVHDEECEAALVH